MVLSRTEVYRVLLLTSFYLHLQEVQVVGHAGVGNLQRWIVLYVQVSYVLAQWQVAHPWVVLIKIVQVQLITIQAFLERSDIVELVDKCRMLDTVHVVGVVPSYRAGSFELISLGR